jgi:anaerobic ribonucleoside-triphosphate reductase activating protein
MLRFHNYSIVFQEIPGETTLAINLTNCPNRCKGCHSPHLMEDSGEILSETTLSELLTQYGNAITCICFMGGDANPLEIRQLAAFVRTISSPRIKTAWYSGKPRLPEHNTLILFDFIKTGPYIESLGPLNSPTTNQRLYRIENGEPMDVTGEFWRGAMGAL